MASESEPESASAEPTSTLSEAAASVAESDRPKRKKAKRPRLPIPRTEAEIDSPTKQTLGMLGVLGLMTVIMWVLARGACNYHPPMETRVPRHVTLAELARDPKDAALELQQRWLTHDFDGALELASGQVAEQIKHDQAACNAACLAQRSELDKSVLTSAEILDANPLGATARVTSVGGPDGTKRFYYVMERADTLWKASERSVQAPSAPAALVPSGVTSTSAAASAAPSASAPSVHHASPTPAAPH